MTSTTILGYVIFSGERKPVAGKDTEAENETVNVGYWENHDSIRRHDQTKAGRNKMSEKSFERKEQTKKQGMALRTRRETACPGAANQTQNNQRQIQARDWCLYIAENNNPHISSPLNRAHPHPLQ